MSKIKQIHKNTWHPCSQMKDYETFPPVRIKSARGSYLYTESGQAIIDAISSWWCKSLGHNHPRLKQALIQQVEQFEHVILANTTNEAIEALSHQLSLLTNKLNKVFYAGDGSCAVEVAMKMSLHAHLIQGNTQRIRFITLENSYHGETAATLSVSDVGMYRDPYRPILFDSDVIRGIPYVSGKKDPLWQNCATYWPNIQNQLEAIKETATALIVEPIVQGAGGMKIYSQDFLRRLRAWTKENNIHLIADEIMTGLGRTGLALACHHAEIEPDIVCLSKGLTSGWLAFSAVLTSQAIYQLFYDDYETGKAFLHSHTYSGNALAVSVALATLDTLTQENLYYRAQILEENLTCRMEKIASTTQKIKNIRSLGGIVAADLNCHNSKKKRVGYAVYQKAIKLGALLRPLGNTIYWLPPLNINQSTLDQLHQITEQAIIETL